MSHMSWPCWNQAGDILIEPLMCTSLSNNLASKCQVWFKDAILYSSGPFSKAIFCQNRSCKIHFHGWTIQMRFQETWFGWLTAWCRYYRYTCPEQSTRTAGSLRCCNGGPSLDLVFESPVWFIWTQAFLPTFSANLMISVPPTTTDFFNLHLSISVNGLTHISACPDEAIHHPICLQECGQTNIRGDNLGWWDLVIALEGMSRSMDHVLGKRICEGQVPMQRNNGGAPMGQHSSI